MKDQNGRTVFKRALEKSLDLLGESSKRTLLAYLEKEYNLSFKQDESPKLQDLESALKSILGKGAHIITEEFQRNIRIQTANQVKKRPMATKHTRRSV